MKLWHRVIYICIAIATFSFLYYFLKSGEFSICGGRGASCFTLDQNQHPVAYWGSVIFSVLVGFYALYLAFFGRASHDS